MTLFQNAEVRFEVPDEWTDQTAVVFAERDAPGLPATVSLVRSPMGSSDTLRSRTADVLRRLTTELPSAKVHEQTELEVSAGVPGAQILVEWRHPKGAMLQLLTLFVRDGVFWSITASGPKERLDALDPVVQKVLGSLDVAPPAAVTRP